MKKRAFFAIFLALTLVGLFTVSALADYTAGSYTASANGNNGPVTVEVEFSDTAIVSVTVTDHNETAGISDTPIERIPKAIVEGQTLAVDTVSGASNTSNAILSAVSDCVAQAGGDVDALKAATGTEAAEPQEITTQVLVIGSGFAGLSAANTAAEAGADVLVIEKLATPGGASALSGGQTYTNGDIGERDAMYEYWIERGKLFDDADGLNTEKIGVFIDNIYPTLDWLTESIGIEFDNERAYTNPVRRSIVGGTGGLFIEKLVSAFENKGTLMLETKAESLLQDESGAIVGAIATAANGAEMTIHADKVILATGSIANNQELVAKYAPDYLGFEVKTAAGSTGDGLLMALDVGAVAFEDAPAVNNYAVTAKDGTSPRNVATSAGLFVGQDGSRRSAENEDRYYINTRYLHVPEGPDFYAIYDANAVVELENQQYFEENIDGENIFKADTLEDLAAQMNIDYEALSATVARYNELCAQHEDVDLGKPADLLHSVEVGPFYASRNHEVIYSILGGVKTNTSAQVLDADGNVIKNLYAAGDMSARDMYSELYIGSSAVTNALVFGRIAGAHAAANE